MLHMCPGELDKLLKTELGEVWTLGPSPILATGVLSQVQRAPGSLLLVPADPEIDIGLGRVMTWKTQPDHQYRKVG